LLGRDEEDINGIKRRISKLVVYINKYQKTLSGASPDENEEANEAKEADEFPVVDIETNENEEAEIVIDETSPTGDEELDILLVDYNLLQRFLYYYIMNTPHILIHLLVI